MYTTLAVERDWLALRLIRCGRFSHHSASFYH